MTRLVLVNGAPGSGKSTLAQALAEDDALALALDLDTLKHALGRWDDDLMASGLHARRLALALAREQLRAGYDVVVGQYLARTEFIEALEQLADEAGARLVEVILALDVATLAARLAARATSPSRPEHAANNALVGPDDAAALLQSLEGLRQARPQAVWVDASGTSAETLDAVRVVLSRR